MKSGHGIPQRTRLARLAPVLLPALLLAAGAGRSLGSVETSTRFLEFDQTQRLLAYEITLRNLASLPVSFVRLEADPAALEGALEVGDLVRDKPFTGRFTFRIPEGKQIFQPRFFLSYTNYDGERIKEEPQRSQLIPNSSFIACDLDSGWVDMRFTLSNPQPEPVLFVELRCDNPSLDPPGPVELGSIEAGASNSRDLRFRIRPGERFFNPTLYVTYHAFHAEGTRIHRSFYTLLLPDLSRLERALEAKREDAPADGP